LVPLSPLYRAGVALRNAAYDAGIRQTHRAAVPVLSVGNLTTGGTGKTPITRALASQLTAIGERPAILIRGYRARGDLDPVPPWDAVPPVDGLARFGDEALGHARALPGVWVFAHPDRVTTATRAIARGASVLVLDDGFQHRRLARDGDFVCLDATRPFGTGGLLPGGDLREPPGNLRRADVIFWTRWSSGAPTRSIEGKPSVRWSFRPGRFRLAGGGEATPPETALLFAGLGNPAGFSRTAEEGGVRVVGLRAFRDHHPYDAREITGLENERTRLGAAALLTTEKDEIRVLACEAGRELAARGHLFVLELIVEPVDPIDDLVRRWMNRRRGS
jgi:tetraacyldisaccharide 4'-kinase